MVKAVNLEKQTIVSRSFTPCKKPLCRYSLQIVKFKTLGFDVMVETKTGAGAFADDDAYRNAGAKIAADAIEVFQKSDIILKVRYR